MNQEVTDYIGKLDAEWKIEACNRLREAIHRAIPDVTERIQYRKPHFLKNSKYAAVIAPAKGWVSFTIFNASELEAPAGLFQPDSPPERKTVRILEGTPVDYDALSALLQQASAAL